MVKETKFFRKQAAKAESAARAALDAEISDGLFALALAYRNQSDLLKKRLKTKTKNKTVKKKKVVKEVQSPTKKSKRKHSTKAIGRKRRS